MQIYRTTGVCPKVIIAGEVDDICWNGHNKGGGEAPPQRGKAFISSNFPQPIESGVERFAASFVNSTISSRRFGGVGNGR